MAARLEDFLQGKPLDERMARLMKGESDDGDAAEESSQPAARSHVSYADGKPLSAADRKNLRRMAGGPGWQVLLKLLDTEILALEDAAKARSIQYPRDMALPDMWSDVAGLAKARNRIVKLADENSGQLPAVSGQ